MHLNTRDVTMQVMQLSAESGGTSKQMAEKKVDAGDSSNDRSVHEAEERLDGVVDGMDGGEGGNTMTLANGEHPLQTGWAFW